MDDLLYDLMYDPPAEGIGAAFPERIVKVRGLTEEAGIPKRLIPSTMVCIAMVKHFRDTPPEEWN